MYSEEYLKKAHKYCFANRKSIEKSNNCGCFDCCTVFPASQVTNWLKERGNKSDTGWCPYCEMDSLIGDYSHEINESFLSAMHKRFFSDGESSACLVFESFEDLFNHYHSLS